MSLKVLSWNVEGRLSPFATRGRGTPQQIMSEIMAHDADVIFMAEAADGERIAPELIARFREGGYELHTARYEDRGEWYSRAEEDPVMMLLVRIPVRSVRPIRLGNLRSALVAEVIDPETELPVRIFGIHLDDRNEANRLAQMADLVPEITASTSACVVMGDFNAMHGGDGRSHVLRSPLVGVVARFVPRRFTRDVLQRVHEMAAGMTLKELEQRTGLVDADRNHRPTATPKLRGQEWLPSVRLIQIDHIFVSPQLAVTDFQVAHDGGSDHRAISALISCRAHKH